MANQHNEVKSRKKMNTYGKTRRKKPTNQIFTSTSQDSTTDQVNEIDPEDLKQILSGTLTVGSSRDKDGVEKKSFISDYDGDQETRAYSVSKFDASRRDKPSELQERKEIENKYVSSSPLSDGGEEYIQKMLKRSEKKANPSKLTKPPKEATNDSISIETMSHLGEPLQYNTAQDIPKIYKSDKDLKLKRKMAEVNLGAQTRRMGSKSYSTLEAPEHNEIDIFDVPLSDDETITMQSLPKGLSRSDGSCSKKSNSQATASERKGQKKIKVSPTNMCRAKKYSLATIIPESSTEDSFSQTTRSSRKSSLIFSDVKRKRFQIKPLNDDPETIFDSTNSISPPPPHVDVGVHLDQEKNTSLGSCGLWMDLLGTVDDESRDESADLSSNNINPALCGAECDSKISKTKQDTERANQTNTRPQRPRMIDALIQKSVNQSSSDQSSTEEYESDLELKVSIASFTSPYKPRSESVEYESTSAQVAASGSQTSILSQGFGPKFTYNHQRSMLAEEDLMKELAFELPAPGDSSRNRRNRRGSVPKLIPLLSCYGEEENNQVVIKSVHELRKSGAVKRFLDECMDIFDRIGTYEQKSSTRRSGLVELASKTIDTSFVQRFLANSMEQQLFVNLDKETDTISGFLIISIIINILMEGPKAHLITVLCRNGVKKLFINLLDCNLDLTTVCKDRKSNMSKIAQSLIIEYHNSLLKSPIWDELELETLSPRIVALKCLMIISHQFREAEISCTIFSDELCTRLFAIMKFISSGESVKSKRSAEFSLTITCLQAHFTAACSLLDESKWINDYLPILSEVLEMDLSRPYIMNDNAHILIIKMTLQVTNNNQLATEVFARHSLLLVLAKTIVSQFHIIHSPLADDDFSHILNYMCLLLGVLMNFSEWSQHVRECLHNFDTLCEVDPLREMIDIFEKRSENISQAESEQETLQNVVLGYLSVTLGFLSLHPPIAKRLEVQRTKLLFCIEEFILIHKLADKTFLDGEKVNIDGKDHSSQTISGTEKEVVQMEEAQKELTKRLERLMEQMKCQNPT